jgi:hypothetical protein
MLKAFLGLVFIFVSNVISKHVSTKLLQNISQLFPLNV